MGLVRSRRFSRGPSRREWLVVVVALLALVIAACSGGDDTTLTASFDEDASEPQLATTVVPAAGADMAQEVEAGAADDAVPAAPTVEDGGDTAEDGDTAAETEAAEDTETAEEDTETAPGEPSGADPLGSGGAQVTPTASDLGRKLIFTAFLNVEVDDVALAGAEATSIVEGMGGFLFGQNTIGGSEASSELIFKVLPDDFNRTLEALGSVGELRNQSIDTNDVTERVVDLESRIEVAELGVVRLRTALEGATSLEDYAEIERLLLARETELEGWRGELRTLEDRVDLATITLLLTQDQVLNGIELRVSTYEDHDDGASCPGQEGVRVEAEAPVTVCFEVFNVGDQTLTNITLTDTVLEIDSDTQLITVFGSLDELAPGQSALVAHQITPERTLRLRTRVVAVPTDGVSSEQAGPSVSTLVNADIRTFEPERSPGFGDGFSVAVDILKGLWTGFLVLIGFLIPLLVLLPFVWLAWRGWRELRLRRPAKVRPTQPAPPAPEAPKVMATSAPPPPKTGGHDPDAGPAAGPDADPDDGEG